MNNKIYCIVISLLLLSFLAEAQSFYATKRERSLILTGGLGTSTYLGDLANRTVIPNVDPNINIGLQYYFTNRISARAEVNWFTLAGDDKEATGGGRNVRNLSFQSSCFELSAVGMVNLFAHGDRYYRRPNYNVYGFAGIGLMYFNPKATYKGTSYALQSLQTEGVAYSLVTPTIPFGLGFRLKVTPQFNISLEAGFRKTFTDYLDDVSTVYQDVSAFTGPDAATAIALADRRAEIDPSVIPKAGDKRGDPTNNDGYILLNAKIEYYLPWDFGGGSNRKSYSNKRKSNYRYNKKGGVRRK
ncbi:MAG: DUF6089 family protein [Cyclobacteriaceae bacterium]|jgi:Domain of unknown function (DUF6089)